MNKAPHVCVSYSARGKFQWSKLKRLNFSQWIPATLVVLLLVPAKESSAQNPRLELGRRLERFENAWETASSAQRVASVPFLKTAVRSFFTLQLTEAGRQLDQAWLAVRDDEVSNGLTNAMIGSQLLVSPLCSEAGDSPLKVRLTISTQLTSSPLPMQWPI